MTEFEQNAGPFELTRRGFVGATAALGSAAILGATPAQAAGAEPASRQANGRAANNRLPAFPGAEGAGMYAAGGRGGEVYEVTTLADSGQGSLRDAVSESNRTVVFRVSGNIVLESGLTIAGSNLTIAGQTAPGDGICISRYGTEIQGDAHDIVIRYLRFRLGDVSGEAGDGFSTNVPGSVSPNIRNLIIDHCSFSWAVDECLSPYGNYDVTVQWCIISEGLTLSSHPKSRHGYGGLWGGERNTYHHNLLAHQGGRNPRFSFVEDNNLVVDHRNNVIYDYGYTSCYGGEWSNGINMVGNYYKPGPSTLADIAPVIASPDRGGQWHVADNFIEGQPEVSAHNERGIVYPIGGIAELDDPVPFDNEIDTQAAEDAYAAVLANAGAVLPRRDSVDARVVGDVRDGTGRLINSQTEVGGFPPYESTEAPVDSDHDGIPDEWELANGLDPNDPSDANQVAANGYTNLENYLNSIAPAGNNPTVRITSPALNEVVPTKKAVTKVTVEAEAQPAGSAAITRVDFYAGDEHIGTADAAPYRVSWADVAEGTYYLTARAVDDAGDTCSSSAVPVHVNRTTKVRPWTSADVGTPPIPGSAAIVDGAITVKGSGKITGRDSAFHFLHQRFQVGRAGSLTQISARLDHLAKVANGAVAGLMIRDSLDPSAPFMFGGLGFGVIGPGVADDGGMKAQKICIQTTGPEPSIGPWPWEGEDEEYVDTEVPHWLRLSRREFPERGDVEFAAYFSQDNINWTRFGYERIAMPSRSFYIGLAVDGGKEANALSDYGTARFVNVRIDQ